MDPKIDVTVSSPISISNESKQRVNIFLYKVSENAYLKNQEIQGMGSSGRYGHPPLSLDLHYFLTAYGSKGGGEEGEIDELDAHKILGEAMRVFHDHPIISEEDIKNLDENNEDLSLQNPFENLRISLDPLGLEDLTKVWTAITKPYRTSAAYTVSVVQIEKSKPRSLPKLVGVGPQGGAKVYALPIRRPQIDEVHMVRKGESKERLISYAAIGDTLIILGRNFASDNRLILGSVDVTDSILAIKGDSRIEFLLPDNEALQPGPQTISLAFDVIMGDPGVKHTLSHSNQAVFMLVPKINNVAVQGAMYTITGSRIYNPQASCMTLVGDTEIPESNHVNQTSCTVSFNIFDSDKLKTGSYPLRVRVNGVENVEEKMLLVQ